MLKMCQDIRKHSPQCVVTKNCDGTFPRRATCEEEKEDL